MKREKVYGELEGLRSTPLKTYRRCVARVSLPMCLLNRARCPRLTDRVLDEETRSPAIYSHTNFDYEFEWNSSCYSALSVLSSFILLASEPSILQVAENP